MSSSKSAAATNAGPAVSAQVSPEGAVSTSMNSSSESPELRLLNDVGQYLQNYARERPEVAALWCFGVGFVLGWRLKPW